MRILLVVCLTIVAEMLLHPQFSYCQEFSVTNVYYSMRDSDVVIHYDLIGPASKPYKVRLVLRRKEVPSYRVQPIDVTGDVGTVERPGKNKEIVWHLYKDMPYGLYGDDYYFEVSVTRMGVEKGSVSWLYYVGGAVIGGAAAVYFGTTLFNKPGSGSSIPAPPLRP